MKKLLIWVARVAGILGLALIVVAGAARVSGAYWLAGFQIGTLLQGGIAGMLVACLSYLATLAEPRAR